MHRQQRVQPDQKKRVRNPEDMWIRAEGAFDPVVDPALFWRAREAMLARARRYSDDELIGRLRQLFESHGWLSAVVIDECADLPSSSVFSQRFGGLLRAYQIVGYVPDRDYGYLAINRRLREMHPRVMQETVDQMAALGGAVERDPETDLLLVNDEFTVSVVLSRCQQTAAGSARWNIRFDRALAPDVTVAVRMEPDNVQPRDYYLLLDGHLGVEIQLRLGHAEEAPRPISTEKS